MVLLRTCQNQCCFYIKKSKSQSKSPLFQFDAFSLVLSQQTLLKITACRAVLRSPRSLVLPSLGRTSLLTPRLQAKAALCAADAGCLKLRNRQKPCCAVTAITTRQHTVSPRVTVDPEGSEMQACPRLATAHPRAARTHPLEQAAPALRWRPLPAPRNTRTDAAMGIRRGANGSPAHAAWTNGRTRRCQAPRPPPFSFRVEERRVASCAVSGAVRVGLRR